MVGRREEGKGVGEGEGKGGKGEGYQLLSLSTTLITFDPVFLNTECFNPLLFLSCRAGNQDKPLVLGNVSHLPAIAHSDAASMVVS